MESETDVTDADATAEAAFLTGESLGGQVEESQHQQQQQEVDGDGSTMFEAFLNGEPPPPLVPNDRKRQASGSLAQDGEDDVREPIEKQPRLEVEQEFDIPETASTPVKDNVQSTAKSKETGKKALKENEEGLSSDVTVAPFKIDVDDNFQSRRSDDTPFVCTQCNSSYQFFVSLLLHIRQSHGEEGGDQQQVNGVKKEVVADEFDEAELFPCKKCDSNFDTDEHLKWHLKKDHGDDSVTTRSSSSSTTGRPLRLKIVIKNNAPFQKGKLSGRTLMPKYMRMQQRAIGREMPNDENPKIFHCFTCEKYRYHFNTFNGLQNHINKIHGYGVKQAVVCKGCPDQNNAVFGDVQGLKDHVLSSHKDIFISHRCPHCRFGTTDRKYLNSHLMVAHAIYPQHKCEICPVSCFSLEERDNHMARDHGDATEGRQCKLCNKLLFSSKFLPLHMKVQHHINNPDAEAAASSPSIYAPKKFKPEGVMMENDENPPVYGCSVCDYFNPTNVINAFEGHFRGPHRGDEIGAMCTLCPVSFRSIRDLKNHLADSHPTEYQVRRCNLCRFGTDIVGKLRAHKLQAHPEVPHFECTQCETETAFFSKEDLFRHTSEAHPVDKRFECPVCFKGHTKQVLLTRHLRVVHNVGKGSECNVCGQFFKLKANLVAHMMSHHGEDEDSHRQDNNLGDEDDMHMNTSGASSSGTPGGGSGGGSEPLECFFACGFTSRSRPKLMKHISIVHGDSSPPFNCNVCGLPCNSTTRLMEHYNSVHMGLRPFVCDGCGLNFSRKSNMTKHQRKGACKGYKEKVEQQTIADLATNNVRVSIGADGGDTFICDKCDKVFKYKQSFRQHIERVHQGKKDHQCDECGRLFTQVHHLRMHRVKEHNAHELMPNVCTICSNRFVSIPAWKVHMRRYHNIEDPGEPTKISFNDTSGSGQDAHNESKESLPEADNNDKDEQEEEEEKADKKTIGPFYDAKTRKRMMRAGGVTEYQKWNSVMKSCPAENCEFQSTVPGHMKEHIKNMHDSRPFVCKKCNMGFKLNAHMKTHDEEVHQGIRPHVCESCGFSFGRKSNLVKHQRHNACAASKPAKASRKEAKKARLARGEHPNEHEDNGMDARFLCDQCDKCFKYRQSLQYHIESVHMDKKDFACNICGRGFTRLQRLREHQARMHGEGASGTTYSCDECDRTFLTGAQYKLHMRKFHDIILTEDDINRVGGGVKEEDPAGVGVGVRHLDQDEAEQNMAISQILQQQQQQHYHTVSS